MSEERDDVLVLVDENGEELEFEYLDMVEMNGKEYVVLVPYKKEESPEDEYEEEVVIFRLEHGTGDEDTFVSIEDEDELNEVFEEFQSRMEDEGDYDAEE